MISRAGPIHLFARHPTAANLLMVLMIIVGLFALTRLNTQFFPSFGIDVIQVAIEWPGASAEDVDDNIVQAIEPEVRFLDYDWSLNAQHEP
jgi:multidrug efflux pump subunit AcrB